jgi:outer membrane biosynthesis protein TonB
MYYYDPDDNSRSRRGGYIALTAYAVALMCVFVFASFTIEMPNADEGILIDFGTTATGSGRVDMAMSEPAPKPTTPRPKAPKVEQDIVTSQQEDAPAVVQKPQTKPKPVEEVVEP